MLPWEIPMQAGGSYLMNQRTFALLLTMSDAYSWPLWTSLPASSSASRGVGFPSRNLHIMIRTARTTPVAVPTS